MSTAAAIARVPEVMTRGIQDGLELLPLIDASDVLVVGPGLGQSDWSEQVLRMAARAPLPLICLIALGPAIKGFGRARPSRRTGIDPGPRCSRDPAVSMPTRPSAKAR